MPLSGKDKKLFEQSAKAVEKAFKEHNSEAILRFAPSIIAEFQNVLLDPNCGTLRNSYKAVQDIYSSVIFSTSLDSFQTVIKQNFDNQNFDVCIKTYQIFYPRIKDLKNDSLTKYHRNILISCCKRFYDNKPTYGTLKLLQQYSIISPIFIDSLKNDLENRDNSLLVKLSTERNVDSLLAFKREYPGLYEKEVDNLLLNYRSKWRISIKRHPTVERIEQYMTVYAEKDHIIDSLYEGVLFKDFQNRKSRTSAMKYLSNFPDGKFATDIQDSIKVYDYAIQETNNVSDSTQYYPLHVAH